MRLSAEERRVVAQADQIKREKRKEARASRPPAPPREPRIRHKAMTPTAEGQRRPRSIDKVHKGFIAQLFCVATFARTGVEAYGVHVAHVRHSYPGWSNPGLQRKPDDWRTLPLAPDEHRRQHAMNEAKFYAELGIYPPDLCRDLYAVTGNIEAAKQVIRQHVKARAA